MKRPVAVCPVQKSCALESATPPRSGPVTDTCSAERQYGSSDHGPVTATFERSLFAPHPGRFEAGTGNIADAVGLAEAVRYVEKVGIERINAYEHALLDYATPLLAAIPGVRLVGTADEKASVLSFVLAGHEPLEVGKALNAEGIAVRAGHHCAQPILRRLGLEATVRPSFAFYNTFDEIDVFIAAVRRIAADG